MKLILIALTLTLVLSALYYAFFIKKAANQKKSIILTFLGAPGSGKGTVAQQCVEQLNMQVLSTGNLCRQAIARGDELIKGLLKDGKLIPDEMISDMVKEWLDQNASQEKTIILDGYPRTARQAELLTQLLKNHFPNLELHVVSIELSDDAIVKRISNRLVCENKACQAVYNRAMLTDTTTCQKCGSALTQREDDREDVVKKRLEVYAQNNAPLITLYRQMKLPFHTLNVENKSMENVFADFKKLHETIK